MVTANWRNNWPEMPGIKAIGTNTDSSKIVDLQQRQASQAASTDRVGDLLKLVRTTALKRVNGLVSNLFENIDDALFDLAEKAENNAVHAHVTQHRC